MAEVTPTTSTDPAGPRGETLEAVSPILWPGLANVDLHFIQKLATRLRSASFREPTLLNVFALRKACLTKILVFAKECFAREKNILDVVVPHQGKVHVFGDVHGDYHSLLHAISKTGWPDENNFFCFAGDFVDRGSWGVEVLVLVFLLKLWKPHCVFVARGNHETTGCISRYGFTKEVQRKYDDIILSLFTKAFRELPCAAVLRIVPATTAIPPKVAQKSKKRPNTRAKRKQTALEDTAPPGEGFLATPVPGERRILVMHGGLFRTWKGKSAKEVGDLSHLMNANRRLDDPAGNLIEDVIWSDPQTNHREVSCNLFRGAGILYGEGAVEAFFKRNGLCGLIRAHEGPDMREKRKDMADMLDGYSVDMDLGAGFVATVFTAADYPPDNPRGNKGAFATLVGKGLNSNQILPDFSQFEKHDFPTDGELFYKPDKQSATPRHSFS